MNINKIYIVTLRIPVTAKWNMSKAWATTSLHLAYSRDAMAVDSDYNQNTTFEDIKYDAIEIALNNIGKVLKSEFYKPGRHNSLCPKSGFSYRLYDAFNCEECIEKYEYTAKDFTLVSIEETTFEFNTEFNFIR